MNLHSRALEMEKEARKVEYLFNRTTQIWIILEEDKKVQ
jgi:hypothetical protein